MSIIHTIILIMMTGLWVNKTLAVDVASADARVVSVIGRAFIDKKPLGEGATVAIGGQIETAENSAVKLLMPDRTILDIGASSRYRLNEYSVTANTRKAEMTLEMGSVRASVMKKMGAAQSKFYIRTKASVLAVRGTEFSVEVRDKEHTVTVSEGKVDVMDPSTLKLLGELPIGYQATLQLNKIQISSIGPAKAQGVVGEFTVVDPTFHRTVVHTPESPALDSVIILVRSTSETPKQSSVTLDDIPAALGGDLATGTSPIPGMVTIPGGSAASIGNGSGVSPTASIQIRLGNP